MTIEEEIARALHQADCGCDDFSQELHDQLYWAQARAVSPLLTRVRAEALREFADRYQDEADWNTPADIDPELLRPEAGRIEQNSEGNET